MSRSFILSFLLISGCSGEESPIQFNNHSTRETLFPLAKGSYWRYSDQRANDNSILTRDEFFGTVSSSISVPMDIDFHASTYYYLSVGDYAYNNALGPSSVWTENGGGYIANDTAVFSGLIMTETTPGPYPIIVDTSRGYIPLQPKIGHTYGALTNCVYQGLRQVETPAYSGPAHYFAQIPTEGYKRDTLSYWFADGVGLVKFERLRGSDAKNGTNSLVLEEYYIGED